MKRTLSSLQSRAVPPPEPRGVRYSGGDLVVGANGFGSVSIEHLASPLPHRRHALGLPHLQQQFHVAILDNIQYPLPCRGQALAPARHRVGAVVPEQRRHDGHELDLRKLPAGAVASALRPGEVGTFCRLHERLSSELVAPVGGAADPALRPPGERVTAPCARVRVRGLQVRYDEHVRRQDVGVVVHGQGLGLRASVLGSAG